MKSLSHSLSVAILISVMMVGFSTDQSIAAVVRETYDVTITAHCNTEAVDVSVSITIDGSPSGQSTPYAFTSLGGTHNFTVPSTDLAGHPFKQWSTGQNTTTITVTSYGTYTAYYEARPVGGVIIHTDRLGLPASYMALASFVGLVGASTAVAYMKRRRKA